MIPATCLFFEAGGLQGHLFEKTENGLFRYALEKCVYPISGLYRFLFGQDFGHKKSHLQTDTRDPLTPLSRGFDCSYRPSVFQFSLLRKRERGGVGRLGKYLG